MAEAALEPTPESDKFIRLSRVLIQAGTKILRGLFDSIHDPSILPRILQNHRALKARKIIAQIEMVKLFPSNTTYGESKNFDLTLLVKLLRNIYNITFTTWDKLPNDNDLSVEARIKFHRNETYAHTYEMDLTEHEFNDLWPQIQDALLRIMHHYSPGSVVDEWRMAIEESRTAPISSEDRRALLNEFPAMVITVNGAGDIDITSLDQVHRQTLLDAIQKAFPTRYIIVQNIYNSSVNIQLRVKTIEALEDLWERFENGDLRYSLERVLIETQKFGKHMEISVTMSEEQYQDALIFFDELTQHKSKGSTLLPPSQCIKKETLEKSPITHRLTQALKIYLDPERPMGKDYQDLADSFGYNSVQIQYLETRDSPTVTLLEENNQCTIEQLRYKLKEMRRDDTVGVIDEFVEQHGCNCENCSQ